jgi:hypothetical protein
MRELLLIAAASFVTIWDVAANDMDILRTVVLTAVRVAGLLTG